MHPTSIILATLSVICTKNPVLAQDQQVKSDFNLTVVVPLDVMDQPLIYLDFNQLLRPYLMGLDITILDCSWRFRRGLFRWHRHFARVSRVV
jgi:hypothetical protein